MLTRLFVFQFILFTFYMSSHSQNWVQWEDGSIKNVNCLFVDTSDNTLYAGGTFVNPGNDTINNLAGWTGTNWNKVGNTAGDFVVSKMTMYNGNLYVIASNNMQVYKLNDSIWLLVGGGMDNAVKDIVVFQNELYAVGFFGSAGGIPAYGIAKWNDTIWSSVPSVWALSDPRCAIVYKN